MRTLFLFIRHGHSEANRDGYFGGQMINVRLTETGLKQAALVSAYVQKHYVPDAIYASDLLRARQTAEAVARPFSLPIQIDPRLRELYGGLWDGLSYEIIGRDYPEDYALWQKDFGRVRPPEGETAADVQARALTAIREIAEANENKTVVVVTHRGLLRTLQCAWEHRPIEEINQCAWLSNGSVTEVLFEDGRLLPQKIGQDDFMGDALTTVTTAM